MRLHDTTAKRRWRAQATAWSATLCDSQLSWHKDALHESYEVICTLHMTPLRNLKKPCAPGTSAHFARFLAPLIWKLRYALAAQIFMFRWQSYQFQLGMIKSLQITQALWILSLLDSAIELWESLRCLICFQAFAWARLLQQRRNVRHYDDIAQFARPMHKKKCTNTTLPLLKWRTW